MAGFPKHRTENVFFLLGGRWMVNTENHRATGIFSFLIGHPFLSSCYASYFLQLSELFSPWTCLFRNSLPPSYELGGLRTTGCIFVRPYSSEKAAILNNRALPPPAESAHGASSHLHVRSGNSIRCCSGGEPPAHVPHGLSVLSKARKGSPSWMCSTMCLPLTLLNNIY